jgi:hypothetical protein
MQLIGTGKQRSGKTARILVGAQVLTYASWKNDLKGDEQPTLNFESYNVISGQSYDEGILGALGCDTHFGGDWDAGLNPLNAPPGLFPRDDLAGVTHYTSRLDNVFWAFPFVRLRSASNGAEVKGKVAFDCGGMSQGPFTVPTGSV